MNEMKIFEHPQFGKVRTITESGRTLFCGKDVAVALGYKDPKKAIFRHCRGGMKRPLTDKLGRKQDATFIPEGDIYRLTAKSELPGADAFESWIFDEVLPSIRKHGVYMTPETIESVLLNPDTIIKLATALKDEQEKRKALELENAQQKSTIAIMEPKANYHDVILQCKDLVQISLIAKDYGWSAIKMNKYLHDKGVQYKRGDTWVLYQKYAECGYTGTRTNEYTDNYECKHAKIHTYWTQAGRLFIYNLLKADDILPLVERMSVA